MGYVISMECCWFRALIVAEIKISTTLPETNISLKMDGWKTSLSFWDGATWQVRTVRFREGKILVMFTVFTVHHIIYGCFQK